MGDRLHEPDPIRALLAELIVNPARFQRVDGYSRLLELLQQGGSPEAVQQFLCRDDSFIGDLLWTVCELDNVDAYVDGARRHIRAPDVGTSAYAVEVLLRSGNRPDFLNEVLDTLRSAPFQVVDHAALVLAAQGASRASDVFRLGGWAWAEVLFGEIVSGSTAVEATIENLLAKDSQEHLFVALVIATLASEEDERAVIVLERSQISWVCDFAAQLRRMFRRRWSVVD